MICDDGDLAEKTTVCDDVLVLSWAASRRGAARLLSRRNLRGDTLLHCVAATGDSARAAILLRHPRVVVDVKNNYGRTALLEACYWDQTDVAIQLIAAGADVNASQRLRNAAGHGDFSLLLAVRNDNQKLVKALCLEPTLRKNQTSRIGCRVGMQVADFARSESVRAILAAEPPPPHTPLEELYGLYG
jgi:ankyrin repeat protein